VKAKKKSMEREIEDGDKERHRNINKHKNV
jgi:hypothetical protein